MQRRLQIFVYYYFVHISVWIQNFTVFRLPYFFQIRKSIDLVLKYDFWFNLFKFYVLLFLVILIWNNFKLLLFAVISKFRIWVCKLACRAWKWVIWHVWFSFLYLLFYFNTFLWTLLLIFHKRTGSIVNIFGKIRPICILG